MDDAAVIAPAQILVAEDDPSILRLVTVLLQRAHCHVDTAVNGRRALEKIQQMDYDVVVLDLMMPELSGLDLLKQISLREPLRKFVIIMSAASSTVVARAISPNVFAVLRKPFEIERLVATVRECISGPGVERTLDCA